MNRVLAFILLVLIAPFGMLLLVLHFICMGWPLFFVQDRVGLQKRIFKVFKLRTYNKQGQIPFYGKLVRNLGLDELPQLINVLKGEMHFIGPRPLTLGDVKRLEWDTDYHAIRWQVKPGITGLAQLSKSCHRKISFFYDKYYVEHRSLRLDMYIVLQSILVTLVGKNVLKRIKRK